MTSLIPRDSLIWVPSNDWLPNSPIFANSTTRGFLSESGVVFNFVQRVSHSQDLLTHAELIKSSRRYRSVIHSWFLKVADQISTKDQSIEPPQDLVELAKIFTNLEIAWHLCEILYIDMNGTSLLLGQLLQWIKWHFTQYVEIADQVVTTEVPQQHEYYWDVIMFFALRGDMANASILLDIHTESKSDPLFITVRDLLKKYPVYNTNIPHHEYFLRWQLWHTSVMSSIPDNSQINNSQKKSTIQLNLLLNLLAGDLESFKTVTYLFHSWYQMMVSYLLFTDHALKGLRLDSVCDEFVVIFYGSNIDPNVEIDPFDELIRSAFNYDLMDVIKRGIVCFNDNWWFVAHFVDLIYNSCRSPDFHLNDISGMRQSFINDYADALMRHQKRFWQLSIEYRVNCPDSMNSIHLCLDHIHFDNERELQKLLTYARRFELIELEQSLCRIQARKWLTKCNKNKSKLGSALIWAIRSRDKMMINHIVEQYLRHYLVTAAQAALKMEKITGQGELLDMDVVSNISPMSIVLSERLIFLCKYHEYHQLKAEHNLVQAGKILVDMLASNAVPSFFTLQVIFDCWPLLESEKLIINAEQTCKILASFEHNLIKLRKTKTISTEAAVWNYNRTSPTDNGHQQSEQDEQIRKYQRKIMDKYESILRLALSRNLSRNFVMRTMGESYNNGKGNLIQA